MSRLKFDKVAIWENKRRIRELTFFRDLYLEFYGSNERLIASATGEPLTPEERTSELNRRLPIVRQLVALAEISATRDWLTLKKSGSVSTFLKSFGTRKDCKSVTTPQVTL